MSLLLLFRPSGDATPSDSDTGSGTEGTPAIVVVLSSSDTGSATEPAVVLAVVQTVTDDGAGSEGAVVLAVAVPATDAATGSEGPVGLAVAVSGGDSGTGGDTGDPPDQGAQDADVDGGLDISYSDDQATDREIQYFDLGAGEDGGEVVGYIVHVLSDTDQGMGTELQFLETVRRRRTALSHLGGWADEGSITYPRPGV